MCALGVVDLRAAGVVEYEHDDETVSVLLDGTGDVAANLPRDRVRNPFLG